MPESIDGHSSRAAAIPNCGGMEAGPGLPRAARIGRALCAAGAAIGAIGLLDAIGATRLFAADFPAEPPMAFDTAIGLFLAGGAGALRARADRADRRTLSIVAAVVVLAIGAGTLFEYLLSVDLRSIASSLPARRALARQGRPAAPTALALAFVGAALLIFDLRPGARRVRPMAAHRRRFRRADLDFWLRVRRGAAHYRAFRTILIGVALPTAASLLLIAVGMLLERPARA